MPGASTPSLPIARAPILGAPRAPLPRRTRSFRAQKASPKPPSKHHQRRDLGKGTFFNYSPAKSTSSSPLPKCNLASCVPLPMKRAQRMNPRGFSCVARRAYDAGADSQSLDHPNFFCRRFFPTPPVRESRWICSARHSHPHGNNPPRPATRRNSR